MHLPGTRLLWGEDGGVGSFLSHHLLCAPGWPQHPVHEGTSSSLMPGTAGGLALEPPCPPPAPPPGITIREAGARPWRGPKHSSPPFPASSSPTTPFRSRPLRPRPREGGGKGVSSPFPGAYWEDLQREAELHAELERRRC